MIPNGGGPLDPITLHCSVDAEDPDSGPPGPSRGPRQPPPDPRRGMEHPRGGIDERTHIVAVEIVREIVS